MTTFKDLGLSPALLDALSAVGYEQPSPIQEATIPPMLEGRDLLGQAQTGTGKTAAFALPILEQIDVKAMHPQALVLTPTRELAIQVAEAFQRYAKALPGFHVLPLYGGQSYGPQLSGLRRGAHVIVGTPGRLIDHLDRGSLSLDKLTTLVLDEADEMLRMGFIDDVERVLSALPDTCRRALFSATMPAPIKRIANNYLRNPAEVLIGGKSKTTENVRQRYWLISGVQKLDALTRILEAEPFTAMIIFTRTKIGTEELAERLNARGFAASAINGDLVQAQRERTIQRLKDGQIDILVATDVAARGLDVDRISHVINYDIPTDTESYVHRIGRTGRAGRSGEAILFVTPRERHLLKSIERATRSPIEPLTLPTTEVVNDARISKFKQNIADALDGEMEPFRQIIADFEIANNIPALDIAAALARRLQGDEPLLLKPEREQRQERFQERAPRDNYQSDRGPRQDDRGPRPQYADRGAKPSFGDRERSPKPSFGDRDRGPKQDFGDRGPRRNDANFTTYRVEVGEADGVEPRHLVGAIANEGGFGRGEIGRIAIFPRFSLVDLPDIVDPQVLRTLSQTMVGGKKLKIRLDSGRPERR